MSASSLLAADVNVAQTGGIRPIHAAAQNGDELTVEHTPDPDTGLPRVYRRTFARSRIPAVDAALDNLHQVAVPDAAIREEDGLHVAYVEVGGESFERRVLDRGPGDGSWTIVRRGLAAGERVVIEGAYQVRLASLGEVTPADHGHLH